VAVAHENPAQLRPRGQDRQRAGQGAGSSAVPAAGPSEALATCEPVGLPVTSSWPPGDTDALDRLWRRLGLDQVTARAVAASSKLAPTEWVLEDAHVDGLEDTSDDARYRVMDRFLEIESVPAERAYHHVADLLNLEVDLLFSDTMSTYFETDTKDYHPDLAAGQRRHGRHPRRPPGPDLVLAREHSRLRTDPPTVSSRIQSSSGSRASADAAGRRVRPYGSGPRVQAPAGCLAARNMAVTGITNKSLRAWTTGILGSPRTMNQAPYDLARLRRNDLIERIPHSNTYRRR
jgi:hypothetical protein